MEVTRTASTRSDAAGGRAAAELGLAAASALPADEVLGALGTSQDGLGSAEAASRLARYRPNAVV